MTNSHEATELEKVIDHSQPEPNYQIKIRSAKGETEWIGVSWQAMLDIEDALLML